MLTTTITHIEDQDICARCGAGYTACGATRAARHEAFCKKLSRMNSRGEEE